jgi:hypothetical protein
LVDSLHFASKLFYLWRKKTRFRWLHSFWILALFFYLWRISSRFHFVSWRSFLSLSIWNQQLFSFCPWFVFTLAPQSFLNCFWPLGMSLAVSLSHSVSLSLCLPVPLCFSISLSFCLPVSPFTSLKKLSREKSKSWRLNMILKHPTQNPLSQIWSTNRLTIGDTFSLTYKHTHTNSYYAHTNTHLQTHARKKTHSLKLENTCQQSIALSQKHIPQRSNTNK